MNYAEDYEFRYRRWRRAAEEMLERSSTSALYTTTGEGVTQDYTLAHMWFNLAGAGAMKIA